MVAPAVEGIDLFNIAGRSISGLIKSFKAGTAPSVRQPFCSQLEERLLLWLEYHPQVVCGLWAKPSGEWLEESERDANFSYETVSPSASTERGQPPPPARAAERGSAPQTDPHRCPRWLWENHAGQ